MIGTPETRLVVLRGNSGSGKTSVATALQRRRGRDRLAVVSQDVVRRQVLWSDDVAGGPAVGLIDTIARYALDSGFAVVVEGILHGERYGDMLTGLVEEHRGTTRAYFWDLTFDETLRRHATRGRQAAEFGEAEMRQWWYGDGRVPGLGEQSIGADATLDAAVARIEADCGWGAGPGRR